MARAAAKRIRSGNPGWKWWQGVLAGILLMLSPGAALLLLPLAAPALLVSVADTARARTLTRTVALFSVAGAIEPLRAFLAAGHDLQAAFDILTRPATIPFGWLCAGFGWLVSEAFCLIAAYFSNARLATRKAALETMMRQIRTEWDFAEGPGQP
jgi:hypothetical protein